MMLQTINISNITKPTWWWPSFSCCSSAAHGPAWGRWKVRWLKSWRLQELSCCHELSESLSGWRGNDTIVCHSLSIYSKSASSWRRSITFCEGLWLLVQEPTSGQQQAIVVTLIWGFWPLWQMISKWQGLSCMVFTTIRFYASFHEHFLYMRYMNWAGLLLFLPPFCSYTCFPLNYFSTFANHLDTMTQQLRFPE